MSALPALRYVDVFPIDHEGEKLVCFRDPTGMVDSALVMTPYALFVASHLDGTTSAGDIQKSFRESFGAEISWDDVMSVVRALDENGYLLTEKFARIERNIRKTFHESPTRPAHHAGNAYPKDTAELTTFLDAQFKRDGGPGRRPDLAGVDGRPLPGLIVPHIDFHRGGHAYAHGYLELAKHGRPDVVIVFGVAHMAEPSPFILTRKDFETPLGPVKTDQELVEELAGACDWDPFEHELAHRIEHSVEFQAVMLARLYGPSVRIVPILCSQFSDDPNLCKPGKIKPVQRFLDACNRIVRGGERRVTVIAGADLAHVGRRFGDPFDISEDIVKKVKRRDTQDLVYAEWLDAEKFYASVMQDGNERRVCGLRCIYAALRTLEGVAGRGEPLCYDYAPDPAGGIVSFATMALR